MSKELFEIKKNNEGYGFLIEKDAGFIDPKDKLNEEVFEYLKSVGTKGIEIKEPLYVYAVFQKYGIPNANGRIYPENILKKVVEEYLQKVREGRAYGELNHPESVSIDGDRISHNIVDLWWDNKTLVGKMEIIMSPGFVNSGIISCRGDQVANLLRRGLKIGVSSRGLGSVEKDRFTGKYIVQDDFELTCWDVVTDPSTPNAWIGNEKEELKPYIESKTSNKNKINEGLDNFLNKKLII